MGKPFSPPSLPPPQESPSSHPTPALETRGRQARQGHHETACDSSNQLGIRGEFLATWQTISTSCLKDCRRRVCQATISVIQSQDRGNISQANQHASFVSVLLRFKLAAAPDH
eukprot:766387-Hanusia_phi.AAC.2